MNNGNTSQRGDSSRYQPIKIIFELTNLCNFSCIHCIRHEGGLTHYLSPEIIEKVLRESQAYHSVSLVSFTGGEPTIHPKFGEIARLVADFGYSFSFVTNAWQYQKTFEQLRPVKSAIGFVNFSIDGATAETHDSIRKRSGSFRKLMEAISLYKINGIPVHINMVITKTNVDEMEAMVRLATQLGCAAVGFAHCQPTPDAVAANMVMNIAERRQVESEIARLQQMYQLPVYLAGDHHNESPFFQCAQLQMREFNIDHRGYLSACCVLSNYRGGLTDSDIVADLNEVSFYEAHLRLMTKINEVNAEKIHHIAAGKMDAADKFICTHCLLHYQKVPDLKSVLLPEVSQKQYR
ncbi:MAG: radical SAM protein [Calditrichae bacterium]|nr:radical SAM protein [Calditrichia bacterium]